MKKVYKLTVYRNQPSAWGGRMSKSVAGEYDTKADAEAAYQRLKDNDPSVHSKAIAVDWR